MGRSYKRTAPDTGRMAGGFVALPWVVLDSPAWQRLSHPGRALLLEMARQIGADNNGRLLASHAYLSKRGWRSKDVIARALRELIQAGFLHQTVQGCRPNKASWFAITWQRLCSNKAGFDPGTAESFRRGVFADGKPLPPPKPTREELYRRWDKNDALTPSHGVEDAPIAPSHGVGASPVDPSHGAIDPTFAPSPTPSGGHHLEVTIYGSEAKAPAPAADGERAVRPAGTTSPRRSIKGRIVEALLSGPKDSPELDALLGTSAAPHVRKRMVLDGIAYTVTAERIPPVPGRSGFGARYTLVARAN